MARQTRPPPPRCGRNPRTMARPRRSASAGRSPAGSAPPTSREWPPRPQVVSVRWAPEGPDRRRKASTVARKPASWRSLRVASLTIRPSVPPDLLASLPTVREERAWSPANLPGQTRHRRPRGTAMPNARRALVVLIDAARRREAHERFAASSMPALAEATTATLIAPSCWTVPSVASLLTGLHPAEHGLTWPLTDRPAPRPTIAEILERDGRTFRLLSGNNLCGPPVLPLRDDHVFRPHDRSRVGIALARTLAGVDYGSRAILREVRRMAESAALPDLLVVHLQEAHHPYLAPPRGLALRTRVRYSMGHLAYYLTRRAQVWDFAASAEAKAWQTQRARYLRCLDYTTGIAEEILRTYERAGALEDALVIVTSDHGEHLGEHGLADHQGSLHEELVNCPCALIAPGLRPRTSISAQFQHTDLLMTITNYLGVPAVGYEPRHAPLDLLDPANHARGHEHTFMQWRAWGADQLRDLQRRNPRYDFTALTRDLLGVRTREWKYIVEDDASGSLYSLSSEAGERRDLSAMHPVLCAALKARLERWSESIAAAGRDHWGASTCDHGSDESRVEGRLRDLGYR
ncbi:MAG: sulfatase-like hydrolase/transferase [Armatimonadia bacterium]|nr:sulfatase-like hydrolase/transferase [Armatimonadia bacterium]